MTKKKTDKTEAGDIPFEQALAELEQLVETMERGDLSLQESLKSFERGIALTRHCQELLQAAEQKVAMLSNPAADSETEPFGQ